MQQETTFSFNFRIFRVITYPKAIRIGLISKQVYLTMTGTVDASLSSSFPPSKSTGRGVKAIIKVAPPKATKSQHNLNRLSYSPRTQQARTTVKRGPKLLTTATSVSEKNLTVVKPMRMVTLPWMTRNQSGHHIPSPTLSQQTNFSQRLTLMIMIPVQIMARQARI